MTFNKFAPIALGAMLGAFTMGTSAQAVTQSFFGENTGGLPISPGPASDAFDAFSAAIENVSYADLENLASAPYPTGVDVNGQSITWVGSQGPSAMSGVGIVLDGATPQQQYPVSPTQFIKIKTDEEFTIDLGPTGTNAFGFFASDIGDFGAVLEVDLLAFDGTVLENVGPVDASGVNGNLIFQGWTSTETFFGVRFGVNGGGDPNDAFGIDDLYVGSLKPSVVVPLPGAGLLLISGIAGLAGVRRMRKA